MIGVKFQGWADKVYHYKTAGLHFHVGDHAVVKAPSGELKVVTVTNVDVTTEQPGIEYKEVFGKVQQA